MNEKCFNFRSTQLFHQTITNNSGRKKRKYLWSPTLVWSCDMRNEFRWNSFLYLQILTCQVIVGFLHSTWTLIKHIFISGLLQSYIYDYYTLLMFNVGFNSSNKKRSNRLVLRQMKQQTCASLFSCESSTSYFSLKLSRNSQWSCCYSCLSEFWWHPW